jgi:putative ABC transport system substrate-binding protein
VKRRDFITLVGGATTWPLGAHGQQPEPVRRIGVLMTTAADDPEGQTRLAAFLQGLQQLGRIAATRAWTSAGPQAIPTTLVNTRQNCSRSHRTLSWPLAASRWDPLLQATHTVPIVFVHVPDPVGAGFAVRCRRRREGGFIFVQNYAAHAQRVCVCIHYDDQGRCTLVTCR